MGASSLRTEPPPLSSIQMDDTALPITGLRKPPKGQMCSGCGYCCTAQPCALAVELLSCVEGPCVALEQDDGRTFCGLVRRPVHYLLKQQAPPADTGALSVHFASMLGLGVGCDSDDDEESASWRLPTATQVSL